MGPGLPPKWPYRLVPDRSDALNLGEGGPVFKGHVSMGGARAIDRKLLTCAPIRVPTYNCGCHRAPTNANAGAAASDSASALARTRFYPSTRENSRLFMELSREPHPFIFLTSY